MSAAAVVCSSRLQCDLFMGDVPDISPMIGRFAPAVLDGVQGQVSIRQSLFNKNEYWWSFRREDNSRYWRGGKSMRNYNTGQKAYVDFIDAGGRLAD